MPNQSVTSVLQTEIDPEFDELIGSASVLDRPLTITRFSNLASKTQAPARTTLRGFAEQIRSTRAASKEKLPLFKLASFGDVRSDKGALRHDANLIGIHGVEADYDAGRVTVDEASTMLTAAGLAALIYTTPSHAPEKPRWRVVCPTDRQLSPDDRTALCTRVNAALGGILAPESFTRSQAFYFGGVSGADAPDVRLIEGRAIDLVSELDSRPVAAPPANDDDELTEFVQHVRHDNDAERVAHALTFIPADNREAAWRPVGMALHAHFGDAGRQLWDDWSKTAPDKFNAREQARIWRSFSDKPTGLKLGTIFDLAKRYGWKPRDNARPSRLKFLSPDDCTAIRQRDYVAKGMISVGDVGCFFGQPGAGKSTLAPLIAYAVARGEPVFGMRTRAAPVFYVAAEDPHGLAGRVRALRDEHGSAPDFTLVDGVASLFPDAPDLAALMEAVRERRPKLIVVDTLAMAFPGLEENSAEGMGRVVAAARELASEGSAVVLIHHDTKSDGGTPRGHSLLNGALDFALRVERDEAAAIVRGKLTKNRNGPCDLQIAFRAVGVELGIDDDGDPITAVMAEPLDAADIPRTVKLSRSESAALEILKDLYQRNGRQDVPWDEWRSACALSPRVSDAEKPDSRARAVRRCRDKLEIAGVIQVAPNNDCRPVRLPIDDAFDEESDADGHGQTPDMSGLSDRATHDHPADGHGHTP